MADIGTNPVFKEDKLFLLHEDEITRMQALERTKELIDLAVEFDKACVCIGKFRGSVMQCGYDESINILKSELFEICSYALEKEIEILNRVSK